MSIAKIVNSPLFIVVLVVTSLFVLQARMKPSLATEIRGAYDEIIRIAEDGGSDLEKTKAIQTFAEQFATQIREGFSAGFSSPEGEKKESDGEKFLRVRSNIVVGDIKMTESQRSNSQEFLYSVTNQSDVGIQQLKLNFEYYKGAELLDVDNDWISEIKVIAPGETIVLKKNRSFPRNPSEGKPEDYAFDSVKITVTSFSDL